MTSVAFRPAGKQPAATKAAREARLEVVRPSASGSTAEPWTDTVVHTSHAAVSVRQTRGEGMPVVLLHGNSSSKDVFRRLMEGRIGAQYRLIAMDFPGHGASSDAFDPVRSYTMAGYADATLEVLESLDIDHAAVVGWSLGGHVGIEMMTLYPGLIGVMISGTPPVGNTLEALYAGFRPHPHLALTGRAEWSNEDLDHFADLTLGGLADESLRAALRRADGRARAQMFADMVAGGMSDQKNIVQTSTIPLAVVNGTDDPIVDTDYVTGLAYAKLWDRRCYLVPRTGHAPFLEAPEIFDQILMRFLRRMAGRARAQQRHASLCFSG